MSLDFEQALKKSRVSYTENFGAPKIPKVSWSDVGGLATAKADILDTIRLPLEHPELFADGLKKRSGKRYSISTTSFPNDLSRSTSLRTSGNGKDFDRQSGSHLIVCELSIH
jgi:hypothetical protein